MNFTSMFEDRRQVLALVHMMSAVTLGLFVLLHWLEGCCQSLRVVECALIVVMLIGYWRIRHGANLARIEFTLMASALLLFSALVFTETVEDTGIFWLAGFPFVAYLVQSVKRARYWVLLLVTEMFTASMLQSQGWIETPYSSQQLFISIVVVLFFWIFAHIYQSQLEWRKQQLDDSYRVLAQQQDRMQVILDHSPIGIWMVDRQRRIQFINKAWERLCGISEQQALQAEDYTTLLPDNMVASVLASDSTCLQSDRAFYGREELTCADGVLRIFDIIKVRLVHADGEISGLVGFAIDVTDKLAAEAEQQSLQQQMQHAQRLESLGLMAGGIAHDFNNLLTVIQGHIELAKLEEHASESMHESLCCIDDAAHAAADLCQQMLDYSGKGVVHPEALNMQATVEDMQSLLRASMGAHVTLSFDMAQQPLWALADRAQIKQMLLNLTINASESIAPERAGEVHVAIRHRALKAHDQIDFYGADAKPGDYVVIRVRDNGCGMDADTLEHIFDPFYTTKFTGRGLGMSAILGILRSHNAAMEIDSTPGKGTAISVWLPAIDVATHPNLINRADMKRQLSGRVLVVDDEPGVIHVASRMLTRLGMRVETASNGLEAVKLFSQDSDFDWVMLDVMMPEMGGADCLQRLREIRPDIYVVMTSGYDADSALSPDSHCQPNDFLSKPFTLGRLRTVVDKVSK